MNAREILDQARDTLTVRRVFGEPIERDGLLVVPVASVSGGAGGGSGETMEPDPDTPHGTGGGGGWGGWTRPMGVFVIGNGQVRWEPAVDVNRAILGGQIALIVGLLVVRSVLRRRARRG